MVKDTDVSINNIFFFEGENGKELVRIDAGNISYWAKNHHKLEAIPISRDRLANRMQMQPINTVTYARTWQQLTMQAKLGADGLWTIAINGTELHKAGFVHELQNFFRCITGEELVAFS
jgi:hypothetical protein